MLESPTRHLGLWPPQRRAWMEVCLFIALCKFCLVLSVPLAQVGMELWEGEGASLAFPNSSWWLRADAGGWWDSSAEHIANWGVIPAHVGWGEPANPLFVVLWAPDVHWGRDDNGLKYGAVHCSCPMQPAAQRVYGVAQGLSEMGLVSPWRMGNLSMIQSEVGSVARRARQGLQLFLWYLICMHLCRKALCDFEGAFNCV